MRTIETIGGRQCLLYQEGEQAKVLLIQPLDAQERQSIDNEVAIISKATGIPFALLAFDIADWERELTPWPDPAISRREDVGYHASETLRYVTNVLTPYLYNAYGQLPVVLGGYSLGGLFSLWAASERNNFEAIAAVSPTVWIANWQDYALQHPVMCGHVYLSLGDREEHARNKAISQVGDNIRFEHGLLQKQLGNDQCTLEWNPGNHFADVAQRTAKGFAWCIEKVAGT